MSELERQDELLRSLGRFAREEQRDTPDVPELDSAQRAVIEQRVLDVVRPRVSHVSGFRQLRESVRPKRWFAWTVPLTAAAAVLLWELRHDPVQPLADYGLEISATAAVTRGADSAPAQVRAGATSTLVLRPARRSEGPVTALSFVERAGAVQALPAEVTADPSGAVRVRVALPAALAGQRARLIVLVTRPERLQVAQELARGARDRGADFQRWALVIAP